MESELKAIGEDRGEMEGLLYKSLGSLRTLLTRKDFDRPQACVKAKGLYRQGIESVAAWLADNECGPIVGDGGATLKATAYAHYKSWAEDNNMKPLGRNHFYDRVLSQTVGTVTDSGRGVREFIGLKLVAPSDADSVEQNA